jgi:hypothetical protein
MVERRYIREMIRNFELDLLMLLDEAVFQNIQANYEFLNNKNFDEKKFLETN